VEERDRLSWGWSDIDDYQKMVEAYPQGPLRATTTVSLPYHCAVELSEEPWAEPLPGHPRSEELVEVWNSTHDDIALSGPLQIGGYADEEAIYGDPVADAVFRALEAAEAGRRDGAVSGDVSDWVLLADWNPHVDGWEGSTVHWSIQREDLAAWRFDRVFTTVYWNP
jgi:hypothetical protein